MAGIAEKAALALKVPEVEEMVKKLADYGLGVCVPHMHDPVTNEMIPLPSNMIGTENRLTVTFVERDAIDEEHHVPVAWFWDRELKTILSCYDCVMGNCRTH